MKASDFIQFLQTQSNIILSAYLCERLNDFINSPATTEQDFNEIARKLISGKKFINDSDFIECLKKVLWDKASTKAKSVKIDKFKGTRWEEQHILAMYLYKKDVKARGLEWIL